MILGQTFINDAAGRVPSHLWFVVSHVTGANRVAVVNISSDDGGLSDLKMLTPGDHPWIKHPSFIRSDRARLASVPQLEAGLRGPTRVLHPNTPATPSTIRVLQGALLASVHTTDDPEGARLRRLNLDDPRARRAQPSAHDAA